MEDYKDWIPSEYLSQYYATSAIAEDERGILRFIIDFLKQKEKGFTQMLEVGCGPTIHHAIPFIPYVGELYMADYLECNLAEIQKVIDGLPDAHDWNQYLSGTLALEDAPRSETSRRMAAFRSKVAGLLPCNVLEAHPLGQAQKTFPLVTSFYTLECVGQSKEGWQQAMRNTASLVAPGGWFILSALHHADQYKVCGKQFPVANIGESDLWHCLAANGFTAGSIAVKVYPCEWAEEGFDTIMVCCAQKEN